MVIMISDIVERAINFGIGAVFMTKESVEGFIDTMVKNGELKRGEAKVLLNEIMNKIASGKKEIELKIEEAVERALHKLDIPTRRELQHMQKRLEEILEKLESKT
ncbi:MAG: hypothetical protein E3K32_08755 [wastewater metagenome]|nr:hypothetical protein [Candidatus Loosdrechtia aerotolerans]